MTAHSKKARPPLTEEHSLTLIDFEQKLLNYKSAVLATSKAMHAWKQRLGTEGDYHEAQRQAMYLRIELVDAVAILIDDAAGGA